jgi:3-oxoacyl-[acyl-carrier protein] reductase
MSPSLPQVAVITGAGSGIGREIARQLARRGAKVLLNDIDASLANEAAAAIKAEGGCCQALAGDASNVPFVQKLVQEAVIRFGRLDAAIANAGLTMWGDFFEFSPEAMRKVLDLNLQGAFFLAQAAARQMRAQGEGGYILLMASNIGLRAYPNLAAYGMTKAALSMLAQQLVLPLSPHGILVNALAPGATLTERTATEEPGYAQNWQALVPNQRVAHPKDVAEAALFLLSPQARHINGHTLVIDGGWQVKGQYPPGTEGQMG